MTTNLSGRNRRLLVDLFESVAVLEESARTRFFGPDNFARFKHDFFDAGVKACSAESPKAPPMFSAPVTTTLSDGSTITVLTPNKAGTFGEWFSAAIGVSSDTPIPALGQLLVDGDHTISREQIDELKAMTDRDEKGGKKTGMRVDGWGNFYPIDSVSVANVRRNGGVRPWDAGVRGLSLGGRWLADDRLVLRNLDTAKLGL